MKFGIEMSELKKRIALGEGVQLDFKFRIEDQKKIARTIVAFANTHGGSLLIGVKDSGKIAGCNPEEEFHMIQGAADVFCQPPVTIESKVWQEGHHMVLEIVVPSSVQKHKAKDDEGEWKFFHRILDHTLLANRITFLLWRFAKDGKNRPEAFTEELSELLETIEVNQPVTISKLFRISNVPKNGVIEHVATLVYWGILEQNVSESGLTYSIKEV